MQPWRQVFRDGIAPQLPLEALEGLRLGLVRNDPRLRPGSTVESAWGVYGVQIIQACAIGYGGWKGARLETAQDIEAFFAGVCSRANEALGDPGACGAFIRWFDGNRREVVFPQLLSEVNRAIAARTEQEAPEDVQAPADQASPQ